MSAYDTLSHICRITSIIDGCAKLLKLSTDPMLQTKDLQSRNRRREMAQVHDYAMSCEHGSAPTLHNVYYRKPSALFGCSPSSFAPCALRQGTAPWLPPPGQAATGRARKPRPGVPLRRASMWTSFRVCLSH